MTLGRVATLILGIVLTTTAGRVATLTAGIVDTTTLGIVPMLTLGIVAMLTLGILLIATGASAHGKSVDAIPKAPTYCFIELHLENLPAATVKDPVDCILSAG